LEEEEVEEGEGVPVVEEDVPTEMSLLRTENVNTKVCHKTRFAIRSVCVDRDSESFAKMGDIRISPHGGWLDGTPHPSTQLNPPQSTTSHPSNLPSPPPQTTVPPL
jgi:hypothetical protein